MYVTNFRSATHRAIMDMIFRALPFLQGHLLPQQTTSIAPFPQHQPLPSNPYPQDSNSEAHAAYDECLKCQDEAGNDAKLLIYARCLGFLIIEAPDDVARDYISHEIMRCEGNGDQMNALAQFYITHLFRLCGSLLIILITALISFLVRNDKGHTPTPSFHPSRPSFEDESFFFSSTVDPALTDHRTSKWAVSWAALYCVNQIRGSFYLKALEHDNFCCMVTGHVEMAYYRGLSNDDRITRHPNSIMTRTHFCHIFPSTSQNLDHDDPKVCSSCLYALITIH